jgi:murein DD-endopeptidase MepM/ murein hydrolase activator NlpD
MYGHNGRDYACPSGIEVRFDVDTRGLVVEVSNDLLAGYGCTVVTQDVDGQWYKHVYWHFLENRVEVGDWVDTGDLLGLADNTGKYTTGSHLHRGLKKCIKAVNGYVTIGHNNGFKGAIDDTPFFKNIYVLDYLNNLNGQISILKKLVELFKKLIK